MFAVIYRLELAVWVDREMDVFCNEQTGVGSEGGQEDGQRELMTLRSVQSCTLCGVSNVGGQGDGLRELTMRSVTSICTVWS